MARIEDRYRLATRLASGGMGEVFLAIQKGPEGFEKVVAIKRILPTATTERNNIKLFLDEARLVAKLSHRNIAQIFELGEDEEGFFIALEYVPGPAIDVLCKRLIKRGEWIHPAHALDIAAQVAEALAYAHVATAVDGTPLKIVHRDVTPQNILVSAGGDAKLIDFGVAKSAEQHHATQIGTVKGKVGYMSPEQTYGERLDGRSDLFSLGIVLYELVTRRNPFYRGGIEPTVRAIQLDPAAAPSAEYPDLAPVDEVLEKLLAKVPERRYGDGYLAAEALRHARAQLPPPPRRLGQFIQDLFGEDLATVIRSVSDSDAREVIRAATVSWRVGSSSDAVPVADSQSVILIEEPSTKDVAGQAGDETHTLPGQEVRSSGDPAETLEEGAGDSVAHLAPVVVAPETVQIKASRRGGRAGLLAAGTLAVLLLGSWALLAARRGPERARVSAQPQPEASPRPAAGPPSAPTVDASTAATDHPAAIDQPDEPAQVEVEAESSSIRTEPRPSAIRIDPKPPARPAPAIELVAEGTFGKRSARLTGAAGRVRLFEANGIKVSVAYRSKGPKVSGTLYSEPWAVVAFDGISAGKSPVELPALDKRPVQVELRRPSSDPVRFILSTRREP